jgi:RNA polymerase sigma-70 factor (ECF subfamily)
MATGTQRGAVRTEAEAPIQPSLAAVFQAHAPARHDGGDPHTPGPARHDGGDPHTPGPAGHDGGDPHTPGPAGVPPEGPDLEVALRRLFEAARRAWPALDLPPEVFVRRLAERGAAGPLAAVRGDELYLACACTVRLPGAVEAFDRAHLGPVEMYLARLRPSAAFVDDVRQALREKLFVGKVGVAPKIGEYDGRAALSSWLRVITVRVAIDLQRASKDAPAPDDRDDDERDQPPAFVTDPEMRLVRQRYRGVFGDAIREAVEALADGHREILRLHFVEGLTLDQLAASQGVHRATVARRVKAAREAVQEDARRRLEARLGTRHAELDSLAGVMLSQIDLSLQRLLLPRGV